MPLRVPYVSPIEISSPISVCTLISAICSAQNHMHVVPIRQFRFVLLLVRPCHIDHDLALGVITPLDMDLSLRIPEHSKISRNSGSLTSR